MQELLRSGKWSSSSFERCNQLFGFSYSNIYVTSPAPENLKILFEFILKGFNALDYQDHLDYDIQYSSNDHKEKIIIKLTIHRPKQHRQIIQVHFLFLRSS